MNQLSILSLCLVTLLNAAPILAMENEINNTQLQKLASMLIREQEPGCTISVFDTPSIIDELGIKCSRVHSFDAKLTAYLSTKIYHLDELPNVDDDESWLKNDDDQCNTLPPVTFDFGESSKLSPAANDEPKVIDGRNDDAQLMAMLKDKHNALNSIEPRAFYAKMFHCIVYPPHLQTLPGLELFKPLSDEAIQAIAKAMKSDKYVQNLDIKLKVLAATTNADDLKLAQEFIARLDQSPLQMPKIEDVD
jgi:hypothetical protein